MATATSDFINQLNRQLSTPYVDSLSAPQQTPFINSLNRTPATPFMDRLNNQLGVPRASMNTQAQQGQFTPMARASQATPLFTPNTSGLTLNNNTQPARQNDLISLIGNLPQTAGNVTQALGQGARGFADVINRLGSVLGNMPQVQPTQQGYDLSGLTQPSFDDPESVASELGISTEDLQLMDNLYNQISQQYQNMASLSAPNLQGMDINDPAVQNYLAQNQQTQQLLNQLSSELVGATADRPAVAEEIRRRLSENFANSPLMRQANEANIRALTGRNQMIDELSNYFRTSQGDISPSVLSAADQSMRPLYQAAQDTANIRDLILGDVQGQIQAGTQSFDSMLDALNQAVSMQGQGEQTAMNRLNVMQELNNLNNQLAQQGFQNQQDVNRNALTALEGQLNIPITRAQTNMAMQDMARESAGVSGLDTRGLWEVYSIKNPQNPQDRQFNDQLLSILSNPNINDPELRVGAVEQLLQTRNQIPQSQILSLQQEISAADQYISNMQQEINDLREFVSTPSDDIGEENVQFSNSSYQVTQQGDPFYTLGAENKEESNQLATRKIAYLTQLINQLQTARDTQELQLKQMMG
jgi:hypothetical protein